MASYGAVIEVSVRGQQELDRLEGSARQIQSLIQGIKQQRNIFDQAVGSTQTRQLKRNLENLTAQFALTQRGARQFTAVIDGEQRTINMYSKTLAGLSHQLRTFQSIASNATVEAEQYTHAITAANKVSNELARTQARAFQRGTAVSGMNVDAVLELGRAIPNTIEGLNFYQSQLQEVLKTVRIGSNEFRALEEAITGVETRLSAAQLTGQKSAITPAAGPATQLDTVAAYQKRASYAQQVADQEYKQLITGQQIVQAKLKENQVEDLQNRLAQASNALAEDDLALAKRLTNELRAQRIVYERKNREQEKLMRPTSMTAGAAESITGRRPYGQAPVPGSPAAWMATGGVQQAEQVTKQLDSQVQLKKRLNNLATSAELLEQKALQYKAQGVSVDSNIASIQAAVVQLKDTSLDLTKAQLDVLDDLLNGLRNELLLRKAIAKTQSTQAKPGAGAGAKGKQATSEGTKTLANVALGAGFPLLFGGGPGAVLGGAVGGFAPTPIAFAAQIFLSAIGQAVDKFGTAAIETGKAVSTLSTAIEYMSEKALFASRQQEFTAKQLEAYGRYSLAAEIAQQRLNNIIGVDGVKNLQKLASETDKLSRAWAEFSVSLQSAFTGILIPAIKFLNSLISGPKETKQGLNSSEPYVGRASLLGGPIPRTQQQPAAPISLSNEQIAKQIESAQKLYVELANLERDLNNKKRQYAEQYFDMSLALTRKQYDLTEQLQRKAIDTQINALREELKILKAQADIQVEIARNAAEARRLSAAPGTSFEANLRSAIEEYGIRRQEIDNESADRERQFKLEMLRLDVENERYKLDVAKDIARTNFDSQIKIARINEEINRQNEEISRKNYARRADILSAELAILRSQTIQLVAQADAALAQSDLSQDAINYFTTLRDGLATSLKATTQLQAKKEAGTLFNIPEALPQLGPLPALKADTRGLIAAEDSLRRRIKNYEKLLDIQGKLTKEDKARLELLSALEQAYVAPLENIIKSQQDTLKYQKQYTQEIETGSITALAEERAQIEALYEPTAALFELEISRLKIKQAGLGLTEKEEETLNALQTTYERVNASAAAALALANQQQSPSARLQAAITQVQGELNNLKNPVNAAIAGATAIGSAFQAAFTAIATGASTTQEALSNFFKSVGEAFVSMAAEIIAKQLVMITLQTILKALGAVSGGGGNSYSSGNVSTDAFNSGGIPGLSNTASISGDYFSSVSAPAFTPYASGGYVTKPTNALIGEGGEPEYVIPASKMSGAMSRYSSGKRGSSVINGAPPTGGGGSQVIRFESTVINNVEYVTRSQAEAMSRQAARQGAAGGYAKTMGGLRNSRATRARVGMG